MNIKKVSEVICDNMSVYESKTKLTLGRLILLAMFAGIFIAIGAASSSAAVFGITNAGLAKCLAGVIFPVGLILVVLIGGELFTGDCLMIFGILDKRLKIMPVVKTLILVFVFNLIGSLVVVFLVNQSGQLDLGDGALGAATIKTAYTKLNLSFGKAFCSAIMCNILVCLAVLIAGVCQDGAGKIMGIFFTIWAFVLGGYEHCVANMYYIPAGLLAKGSEKYVNAAINAGMSADQINSMSVQGFFLNNLLPVTLGNMVGGMLLIAVPLYIIHKKKK